MLWISSDWTLPDWGRSEKFIWFACSEDYCFLPDKPPDRHIAIRQEMHQICYIWSVQTSRHCFNLLPASMFSWSGELSLRFIGSRANVKGTNYTAVFWDVHSSPSHDERVPVLWEKKKENWSWWWLSRDGENRRHRLCVVRLHTHTSQWWQTKSITD